MYNTIILKKGTANLTAQQYTGFSEGDTIFGDNSEPEELKRWPISEEAAAKEELKKFSCTCVKSGDLYSIEEVALEYCETDESGEFVCGSDFDLAE